MRFKFNRLALLHFNDLLKYSRLISYHRLKSYGHFKKDFTLVQIYAIVELSVYLSFSRLQHRVALTGKTFFLFVNSDEIDRVPRAYLRYADLHNSKV